MSRPAAGRPSLSNRDVILSRADSLFVVILRSAEGATKDLVASVSRSTALPCHAILQRPSAASG